MSEVDTSIYGNIANPLDQINKLQTMQTNQQQLQIRGAELGAKQAIGNALMKNTGPDGTVNTDNMMTDLAQSGNPYAQQQGAELAQHLTMQQSLNQQQKILAQQAAYSQMGNEMLGFKEGGDMSDNAFSDFSAGHYAQAANDPNYMGGMGTKNNIINLHDEFTSINKPDGSPDIPARRKWVDDKIAKAKMQSGDYSGLMPSVPTYQNGQPGTIAPITAIQNTAGTPQGGNMPPQQGSVPNPSSASNSMTQDQIASTNALQNAVMAPKGKNKLSGVMALPPVAPPGPAGFNPTGPTPQQAAGFKQMQDSTANLNSDAESAQKQMFALQSAEQLIDKDPSAVGPIRSAMLQLVHTNPGLASGINDPDKLADAQDIQKFLDNAFPRSARSDSDQALLSAASPNSSMLYPAVKRAIQFQMANAQLPVEKQRVLGPALNSNTQNASDLSTQWAQYANPKVAEYAALSPQDRAAYSKNLTPSQKADLKQRIVALTKMGAFPQLGQANGQ